MNPRQRRRNAAAVRRTAIATSCAAGLGVLCPWAAAQSAAGGAGLWIVPTFSTTVAYNDNRGRPGDEAGGEFITRLSPGLQMSSRSGRVRGTLTYLLDASYYSKHADAQTLQHTLSAVVAAEVVEKWVFVDATASVSRQNVSAYGLQTPSDDLLANDNRVEVGTFSISPYVRGTLAGLATYEMRLNAATTNARRSIASDSTTTGGSLSLGSASKGAVLGWSLQGDRQRTDFRAGRATENDRVTASLIATPDPELQLTVRGGQESTDVGATERRRYDNWGWGVRWTPSPRTLAELNSDRRYFGNSHRIALEHRLRRAVVRYTSTRDSTNGGNAYGVGQPLSLFDIYFSQFASIEPDPVLRERLVLEYLYATGQNPNALIGGGFVSSSVSLQRRDDLSLAISGVRTSITLQAFASKRESLDSVPGAFDEGRVRQFGYTATVSHRLTPRDSINLTAAVDRTLGTDTRAGTSQKSFSVGWTGQVGRTVSAALNARYSLFDSATTDTRDTSLIATLSVRF